MAVEIDRDTAQFAVASIAGWWRNLVRQRYPRATSLTITADCGGSNGTPHPAVEDGAAEPTDNPSNQPQEVGGAPSSRRSPSRRMIWPLQNSN